jgi:hypothetical protein
MKIYYTNHVLERLRERGRREVMKAIREGSGGRIRKNVYRNQRGSLFVIYTMRGLEKIVVVTAYRTINQPL